MKIMTTSKGKVVKEMRSGDVVVYFGAGILKKRAFWCMEYQATQEIYNMAGILYTPLDSILLGDLSYINMLAHKIAMYVTAFGRNDPTISCPIHIFYPSEEFEFNESAVENINIIRGLLWHRYSINGEVVWGGNSFRHFNMLSDYCSTLLPVTTFTIMYGENGRFEDQLDEYIDTYLGYRWLWVVFGNRSWVAYLNKRANPENRAVVVFNPDERLSYFWGSTKSFIHDMKMAAIGSLSKGDLKISRGVHDDDSWQAGYLSTYKYDNVYKQSIRSLISGDINLNWGYHNLPGMAVNSPDQIDRKFCLKSALGALV